MENSQRTEELIDLYIRNMLSPEDKASFVIRMQQDSALARQVELMLHIANAIARKGEEGAVEELAAIDSKTELQQLLSDTERRHHVRRPRTALRKVAIAVSCAAVIAVAILGMQPRYMSSELYSVYYERPVYDPSISRGGKEIPYELVNMLEDAGKLYEAGIMPEAARLYDQANYNYPAVSMPDDAMFYYAVALAETDRINEAQDIFMMLAAKDYSEFASDAAWQSALLNLKIGERQKATYILETLVEGDNAYRLRAQELLSKLKERRLNLR